MELRKYWQILWRRWWIPAGLFVLVLAISLIWPQQVQPTYQASMRFTVGFTPEPRTGDYYTYDRYYSWLTAEYIADDFSEVVKSHAFAAGVSARLGDQGITVPTGAISGSTVAEKQHRILTLSMTWPDPDQLQAIAGAAMAELVENNAAYFAQLGAEGATIRLIDPPAPFAVGRSLQQRLEVPIRLFLALFVGVSLVFLWEYLDDSVRDRREVEEIGLPVLGEIPSERRRWL
jgi:capsular polysaccharide biosynthesis protein